MEPRTAFAATNAILSGHFVYKSGGHGDTYVNRDLIYVFPEQLEHLCLALYESVDSGEIGAVAGPAIGAALIAQLVARRINFLNVNRREECLAVYAEQELRQDSKEETGRFVFRRGYDRFLRGKKVLVVDDVLTTGGPCRKTIEAVRAAGGDVVAVRALWNCGDVTAESLTVANFRALINERIEDYPPENCSLCAAGIPINTDVGDGAAFVREHGKPQPHRAQGSTIQGSRTARQPPVWRTMSPNPVPPKWFNASGLGMHVTTFRPSEQRLEIQSEGTHLIIHWAEESPAAPIGWRIEHNCLDAATSRFSLHVVADLSDVELKLAFGLENEPTSVMGGIPLTDPPCIFMSTLFNDSCAVDAWRQGRFARLGNFLVIEDHRCRELIPIFVGDVLRDCVEELLRK